MNTYETGNTIRLRGTFNNNAGTPTDPDVPTVRVYDNFYTLLGEFILGTANRISTGTYQYDYTIPSGTIDKVYYYEFYGEYSGVPALNRGKFLAKFFV